MFVYALIMLAAMGVAFAISRRTQEQLALSTPEKLGLALGGFCGAMIAAKLPYLLFDGRFLRDPGVWLENGKTIMLGLAGGYAGVELAKWAMDIRIKTGDTFAVPVAVAVALGRLACFHAGCCFGVPTTLPWGVVFPAAGPLPRHPTQLYEFAFHLAMAVLLWVLMRRGVWRGQLMKFYILSYFGYRFVTEFIRPEPRLALGLTAYQWAALALAPIFVLLWIRDERAQAAPAAVATHA